MSVEVWNIVESCLQLLVGCFGSVGIELIGTWPFFGSWGACNRRPKCIVAKTSKSVGTDWTNLVYFICQVHTTEVSESLRTGCSWGKF